MHVDLTSAEKKALSLRMWLLQHKIDGATVEPLFTWSLRLHLVDLVDSSDSLERLLIACVVYTMQCSRSFEIFLEEQVATAPRERAYGFS